MSTSVFSQTSYTKTYDFIPNGESAQTSIPYNRGFLLCSAQGGNLTYENTIRHIAPNDSVVNNRRFGEEFRYYFHPVVTTTKNIFVFGVQTYSSSTEVNYVIMDSLFNVVAEKKLLVPYNIIACKFFQAKDGGVIGVVHELCDESRIFRLDADGNLLWIKSYVGIVSPPGGYDRTMVNAIFLTASNNYLITGHLGFGYGIFYLTIDDNGQILNSKIIETFFTGFYSDVMWRTTFDGEKALSVVDNATNGQDTTFLIEVDTSLNILHVVRLEHSDSVAQHRALMSTSTEYICAFVLGVYAPLTNPRVAVTGLDKQTLQPNWTFETTCDNTQDASFSSFSGWLTADDVPVFMYHFGPINFAPNGSNNYDYWRLTRLDTVTHDGFCDKAPASATTTTAAYITTLYYIDTIPHPACSVMNTTHVTTTVVPGTPDLTCGFTIGVDENISSDASIKMFPNPTTGLVQLNSAYHVTITTPGGQVVQESSNAASFDLSDTAAGLYLVTLRDENGAVVFREKLIRE